MPGKAHIRLTLQAVLFVAASALAFYGQAIDVEIKTRAEINSVEITGKFIDGGDIRNIAFEREYAGVSGLAERISGMKFTGADGKEIAFKTFAPGEYVASGPVKGFSYRVSLDPPARTGQAHISWLKNGRGLYFLGDLLPLALGGASQEARIVLSGADVALFFGECYMPSDDGTLNCHDRSRAVLARSKDLVSVNKRSDDISLCVEGDWGFDKVEAAVEMNKIFREYQKVFGGIPFGPVTVSIMRFADETPPGVWEAGVRGNNVIILSSDSPFKSQSLQQLSSRLRHELFHLWMPNGVALSGRYEWFYEGAAIYMSQKLGVAMNRTRFDDLVSSLSTAIAYDRTAPKGLSLAMAGDTRWSGNAQTLYARGMLAAFILDVELLKRSKAKHSLDDVLRKLFSEHGRRKGSRAEADPAIIDAFAGFDNAGQLAKRLLERTEPLDLTSTLENSGFELSNSGRGLKVKEEPDSREKVILNKLGYNNWRKLSLR